MSLLAFLLTGVHKEHSPVLTHGAHVYAPSKRLG